MMEDRGFSKEAAYRYWNILNAVPLKTNQAPVICTVLDTQGKHTHGVNLTKAFCPWVSSDPPPFPFGEQRSQVDHVC
jgi:hypothetical protein